MTRGFYDNCCCIIDYQEDGITWISTIRKCGNHKSLDGQILLNQVLLDNKNANPPPANSITGYTALEKQTISQNKAVSYQSSVNNSIVLQPTGVNS